MKSIAVFCASSMGFDAVYYHAARQAGQYIAQEKMKLVYGGGRVGLMGAVAEGAMEFGGEVIGIIPRFLNSKEIGHRDITELIEVENMHQRKKMMNDLSDGFIALPGGFGTMEELFEVITWAQLGLHQKPVGLLNTHHFYDGLINFVATMVDSGLLKTEHAQLLLIDDTMEGLIAKMQAFVPPVIPKWITEQQI